MKINILTIQFSELVYTLNNFVCFFSVFYFFYSNIFLSFGSWDKVCHINLIHI